MKLELDVFCVGEPACRVGKGVLEALVLELEFAAVESLAIPLLLLKKERWRLPARINPLPIGALPQPLKLRGAKIPQMVTARRRDDRVPDHGLVGRIVVLGRGPLGRDVGKDLLCVPGEEGGEVGVKGEFDDGVFFLFRRVVIRAAFHRLELGCFEDVDGGGAGGQEVGGGN